MNIFINGESVSLLVSEANVQQALEDFLSEDQQQTSFAVALNQEFVGKSQYQTTAVNKGDSIDILFPIQGG